MHSISLGLTLFIYKKYIILIITNHYAEHFIFINSFNSYIDSMRKAPLRIHKTMYRRQLAHFIAQMEEDFMFDPFPLTIRFMIPAHNRLTHEY